MVLRRDAGLTPPTREVRGRRIEMRYRGDTVAPALERSGLQLQEVRAAKGVLTAVVLRYDVVDSYRTRFRPGVFARSLEERMPQLVWAHDWAEPIGKAIGHYDDGERLQMTFQLDDFDAVPRAKQAYAQLKSGSLGEFSVGFMRLADAPPPDADLRRMGVVDIVEGELDEVSVVLRGAVPGTKLLNVRGARG